SDSHNRAVGCAEKALKWHRLEPGELFVVREGAVIAEHSTGTTIGKTHKMRLPAKAERRKFDITHRTVYRYEQPIERSLHVLRLTPVQDLLQNVVSHELTV